MRRAAQRLIDFEDKLHQLRISGGQDGMRWPARLLEKINHLATEVQESDFAPTDQQIAVNQQYTQEIRSLRAQFEQLLNQHVKAFNNLLTERGLPILSVPAR